MGAWKAWLKWGKAVAFRNGLLAKVIIVHLTNVTFRRAKVTYLSLELYSS